MKRLAISATLVACLLGTAHASSLWETDYDAALKKAKQENRFVLMDFSGSDWCGWCIKLDKEVFGKKDFEAYAEENLVCVMVDSPRRSKLPDDLQQQNDRLKREFEIRGFPTVIVLNPDGKKIGQTGYRDGGPKAYVEHLQTMIEPHRDDYPLQGNASAPGHAASSELRTWTAQSGSTIEAQLVEAGAGWVRLRREDGSQIKIKATKLSTEDQAFLAGR